MIKPDYIGLRIAISLIVWVIAIIGLRGKICMERCRICQKPGGHQEHCPQRLIEERKDRISNRIATVILLLIFGGIFGVLSLVFFCL